MTTTNAQTRPCTVVMYHFVRDVEKTPYPGIKARGVAEFEAQLEYLCRHHEPVTARDFMRFFAGECDLPIGGFYLTFDDGFVEHREVVAPTLKRMGIEGAFFPMTEALANRRVPSVEKLRFLNYNVPFEQVQDEFFSTLANLFADVDATSWRFDPSDEKLAAEYARFDDPALGHFKRTTTLFMPTHIRDAVLDQVFPKHFGDDESFIRELYMGWEDLVEMQEMGMIIGGHTVTHPWLARLDKATQAKEINDGLDQLEAKLPKKLDVFAYPYGSYSADTLEILTQRGCKIAFATAVGVQCDPTRPFEIPRLDTNDVPIDGTAVPTQWSVETGVKS